MKEKKPLLYLGGDIMTRGSNLARQEEYDKFIEAGLPVDVYSPVMNKSINDKSNMTEEENNHLAEKIVAADVERLWNSDYTVLCPEQSAIGTMCEISILYAWKYMAQRFIEGIIKERQKKNLPPVAMMTDEEKAELFNYIWFELAKIDGKQNYTHYFDIRTNHLNEKDWRRSFSINQFLYGICLAATTDETLHNSFDEIIPILKEQIKDKEVTNNSEN